MTELNVTGNNAPEPILSDPVKPKQLGIDLSTLDTVAASNAGFELELNHPTTNVPIGVFITVAGRDSDIFRDHIRQDVNRRTRREAMATKRGKTIDPRTAEEVERESVELLTVCTLGWRNMVFKGEELAFNAKNVMTVYTEMLWVRRQVDEAIGDLENFI